MAWIQEAERSSQLYRYLTRETGSLTILTYGRSHVPPTVPLASTFARLGSFTWVKFPLAAQKKHINLNYTLIIWQNERIGIKPKELLFPFSRGYKISRIVFKSWSRLSLLMDMTAQIKKISLTVNIRLRNSRTWAADLFKIDELKNFYLRNETSYSL